MGKMKLSYKLALGVGCIYLIIIIMQIVSYGNFFLIRNIMFNYNILIDKSSILIDLERQINIERQAIKNIILFTDPVLREREMQTITTVKEKYDKDWHAVTKMFTSEQEKAFRASVVAARNVTVPLNKQVIELVKAGNKNGAIELFNRKADPLMKQWLETLGAWLNLYLEQSKSENEKTLLAFKDGMNIKIFFMILGCMAGLIIIIFVTRSITKPIKRILMSLNGSAQQIAAASEQLSASAQQLSEGSAGQVTSIEETSTSLQESAAMLQQNTANTKNAVQISEKAKESADRGNQEMQEMLVSIEGIKLSSNQIVKIIKVIDDIAFQTNILALNAAIEAARSGETGLGFAVVAEEVRNLAQRSAQAVKDTTDIIQSNIQLSGQGVQVAERVRDALNEITTQAGKVRNLMEEIAAASEEQSQGITQVNRAMEQIEAITRINASNSEESTAIAVDLSTQAENMKKIVYELSQLVNGKTAAQKANRKIASVHEVANTGHTVANN